MKVISVTAAVATCLAIFTACTGPRFSDPDAVAEAYVQAVLAKDGSHTGFELTGLDPELQQYCNLGLSPDWKTDIPADAKLVERLEKGIKGEGQADTLMDYMVGIDGDGPFNAAEFIVYLVEFKFADGDGTEYTAALALRPDHGGQPATKGRVFDWKDVEWKVVPQ